MLGVPTVLRRLCFKRMKHRADRYLTYAHAQLQNEMMVLTESGTWKMCMVHLDGTSMRVYQLDAALEEAMERCKSAEMLAKVDATDDALKEVRCWRCWRTGHRRVALNSVGAAMLADGAAA
jgi:hypothetical protein